MCGLLYPGSIMTSPARRAQHNGWPETTGGCRVRDPRTDTGADRFRTEPVTPETVRRAHAALS
jgi:hypothetical protein